MAVVMVVMAVAACVPQAPERDVPVLIEAGGDTAVVSVQQCPPVGVVALEVRRRRTANVARQDDPVVWAMVVPDGRPPVLDPVAIGETPPIAMESVALAQPLDPDASYTVIVTTPDDDFLSGFRLSRLAGGDVVWDARTQPRDGVDLPTCD